MTEQYIVDKGHSIEINKSIKVICLIELKVKKPNCFERIRWAFSVAKLQWRIYCLLYNINYAIDSFVVKCR